MDYEQVKIQLQIRDDEKMSFVMLLPVFVLLALILLPSMLPNIVPSLSMTIVFMISALLCILTGKKFSVWAAIKEGVNSSLPVMGILMGVGIDVYKRQLVGRGSAGGPGGRRVFGFFPCNESGSDGSMPVYESGSHPHFVSRSVYLWCY